MKKQSNNSSSQQTPQVHPLEAMALRLDARLRASGLTVEVATPSNGTEYTVTFPQARSNPTKKVTPSCAAIISVEWGYELHSVELNPKEWAEVKNGESLGKRGEGYCYEGQFFLDYWDFGGGLDGSLYVDYGDDGANGFIGKLRDASIEEFKA